jgi:hypothetical protein
MISKIALELLHMFAILLVGIKAFRQKPEKLNKQKAKIKLT